MVLAGKHLQQTANRNLSDGESFLLGRFETTRTTLQSGLQGSFKPDTDTITAVLPADAIANKRRRGPIVSDGSEFSGLEVVSRRDLVLVVQRQVHRDAGGQRRQRR